MDKKILENEVVKILSNLKETVWINENAGKCEFLENVTDETVAEASERLNRFAPYLAASFDDAKAANGIIESPLKEVPKLAKELEKHISGMYESGASLLGGKLLIKLDSHLPISGSVKARGGIYEVLKFAEEIALKNGLISKDGDYTKFGSAEFREVFKKYKIAVGSTGNLGLSIGIMSAKLGFDVTVHMSIDAKQWKKDLLRKRGATVVEHMGSYQKAVAEGRRIAEADDMCHFVDDENSLDLFTGYCTAGKRVERQLKEAGIAVDENHPLFVYIPCGVGGAPGGIAYGLKLIYGEHLHCVFVEPTHAPCMLLGMATGLHEQIAVEDIGIDGKTEADGLAVGRPSSLVGKAMGTLLDCISTIDDEKLFVYLKMLADTEGIYIEPSACASFDTPFRLLANKEYLRQKKLTVEKLANATHILWATGGSMVPEQEMKMYYQKGER